MNTLLYFLWCTYDRSMYFLQDPFASQRFSSDVADQSFLFDQALPLNQGFMLSPPYTPYANQTPMNPSIIAESPPYSNFSPQGTPSPLSSCQGYCEDSPYSTGATPTSDHMISSSAHLQSSTCHYISQEAMPTSTLVSKDTFSNGIAAGISAIPGQPMELCATFIPNGNSTSNIPGYTESISLPVSSDRANVFGLGGAEFAQIPMLSLSHAPSQVRQSVIHNARQRYSGATPTSAGHPGGVAVGHVAERVQRYSGVTPTSAGGVAIGHVTAHVQAADDSISQWSQWLKESVPPPVC